MANRVMKLRSMQMRDDVPQSTALPSIIELLFLSFVCRHMIETIGMVSARLDAGQSEMNASFWCIHPQLRLDSEKQS